MNCIYQKLLTFNVLWFITLFSTLHAETDELILETAKQNYLSVTGELPEAMKPSIRWERYVSRMSTAIPNLSNLQAAINYGQTSSNCGFDHRGSCDKQTAENNRNGLIQAFPEFTNEFYMISDSPRAKPNSLFQENGMLLSNIIFFNYHNLCQCLKGVKPEIICEIGGGYGQPAYAWLTNSIHRPRCYINIDYAESLFFAECYLKASLPEADVIYIRSTEDIPSGFTCEKTTIILCPIQNVAALQSLPIDLVTNIGSMQEMDEAALDYWMTWLDASQAKYFYTCNYFANTISDLAESTNIYTQRMSQNWQGVIVKHNSEIPIAPFHCGQSFATILAKRMSSGILQELQQKYWSTLSPATLNYRNFLECMEIFRQTQDQEIAFDLLRKCYSNQLGFIPKEALYICRFLIAQFNDNSSTNADKDILIQISFHLENIYQNAIRGV